MCFIKKSYNNAYGEKTLLAFGINKYSGSPLNGCINDIEDAKSEFTDLFPEISAFTFKDSEATKKTFTGELAKAIAALPEGATVAVITDCCYSGTNTRSIIEQKPKMYGKPVTLEAKTVRKIARSEAMNWIAISGCGEKQTSADAYINGRYNGAFTFYALNVLRQGMTYREWMAGIRRYLPSASFAQVPEIEGNPALIDSVIFGSHTLMLWYSGHGTYVKDHNGDEADGYDEALYLYDGALTDDVLGNILRTIK